MVNGGLINHVWRNVDGVRNEQTAVVLWNSSVGLNIIEPRHDKTNKMAVRPAKTWISLGIRPVWSESSLCAQRVAKDPNFLHADSEDWSDWAHSHFVGFVMSGLIFINLWSFFSSPEPSGSQGELIVYPYTGVHCRRRLQCLNIFSSETALQSKPNFMWSLLGKGERKFV